MAAVSVYNIYSSLVCNLATPGYWFSTLLTAHMAGRMPSMQCGRVSMLEGCDLCAGIGAPLVRSYEAAATGVDVQQQCAAAQEGCRAKECRQRSGITARSDGSISTRASEACRRFSASTGVSAERHACRPQLPFPFCRWFPGLLNIRPARTVPCDGMTRSDAVSASFVSTVWQPSTPSIVISNFTPVMGSYAHRFWNGIF